MGSPLAALVDFPIEVAVGPEVVSGSTRLKAGTAQKIVLNAFSTALMVRRGRTVGGLMAGMRVSNIEVSRARGERVRASDRVQRGRRPHRPRRPGRQLDAALVMLATGVGADEARERLSAAGGAIEKRCDRPGVAVA